MNSTILRKSFGFASWKRIHVVCDEIYSGSVFSSPKFENIVEFLATKGIVDRVHIVYRLSEDLGLPSF